MPANLQSQEVKRIAYGKFSGACGWRAILDYKLGAVHERPIAQLMVYALALSRRTGLRLYDFVCAWFDDRHYFEFYPLHVVHKRGKQRQQKEYLG